MVRVDEIELDTTKLVELSMLELDEPTFTTLFAAMTVLAFPV